MRYFLTIYEPINHKQIASKWNSSKSNALSSYKGKYFINHINHITLFIYFKYKIVSCKLYIRAGQPQPELAAN